MEMIHIHINIILYLHLCHFNKLIIQIKIDLTYLEIVKININIYLDQKSFII